MMIILMYNIALLSGTCSVCRMHYEIQTASDEHCRCLGMQMSLHCTASLTTLFRHLSRLVWLDISSRFSWYSASGGTTGGRRGAYAPPNRPAGAMLCSRTITASKPYVDQEKDIKTFCVTQDREKLTDSA